MLGIILAFAAFTDFKYRKIPNGIDFLLVIYAVFFSGASVYDRIAGFLLTAGTVCVLLFAGGKIKGGDAKFLSICAAAAGLCEFVPILMLSYVIAAVWCIVRKEKSVPLAFVFFAAYLLGKEGLMI